MDFLKKLFGFRPSLTTSAADASKATSSTTPTADPYRLLPADREQLIIDNLIENLNRVHEKKEQQVAFRLEAIHDLGGMGHKAQRAIPDLVKKLFEKDRSIREAAQNSLALIDADYLQSAEIQACLPSIIQHLKRGDYRTLAAQNLLTKIGTLGQEALLHELTTTDNYGIHENIYPLLHRIQPPHPDTLRVLFAQLRKEGIPLLLQEEILKAIERIGIIDDKFVQLLADKIDNNNNYIIRVTALRCLGNCGERAKETIPKIILQLDDDNEEVRTTAINALVDIGPISTPLLIQAIKFVPAYTARDESDISEKLESIWKTTETVRYHDYDYNRYRNISWTLHELMTAANRPVIFNESILIALIRLDFDVSRLQEAKRLMASTANQKLLQLRPDSLSFHEEE